MKKTKTFAFTLAEIMIVLTVIGVLSAILLPVASNSMPDKNIMKFKKTYNDLAATVRELSSSGEYFLPGDLAEFPDESFEVGMTTDDAAKYFIDSFADIVSHKSISYATSENLNCTSMFSLFKNDPYGFDAMCDLDYSFVTSKYSSTITLTNGVEIFEFCSYNGFADDKLICIDLDGKDGELMPFGFNLRRDGKITNGVRANWYLSRDITRKEADCCPAKMADVPREETGFFGDNFCDDGVPVCAE